MSSEVHTVPNGGGWINEVDGVQVGVRYLRKREAIAAGRELAIDRKTEHVIHNLDGQIGEKNSYGNDPPGRG